MATQENARLEDKGTHCLALCRRDLLGEGGEKTEVMWRPGATWGSCSLQRHSGFLGVVGKFKLQIWRNRIGRKKGDNEIK